MQKRNTTDNLYQGSQARDPIAPIDDDEPVVLGIEVDTSGTSPQTDAEGLAMRTRGSRSKSGLSSSRGSRDAAPAPTTDRSEIRIRKPAVVAMACHQAKVAGCKDTTKHVENLILANERNRGAGLRLAREVGRIGLTLSALHEDVRDQDLASPEILAALNGVMLSVGQILSNLLGCGAKPQVELAAVPSRPRRRHAVDLIP